MSDFLTEYSTYNWGGDKSSIYNSTEHEVERALMATHPTIEDFRALISPAATPYLEEMAKKSQWLTQKRFGKTVQLFIPLYLSNECANICTYCGFSQDNNIPRITLDKSQIRNEIEVIKSYGYDHVLVVTGEHQKNVGMDYFKKMIPFIKSHFSQVSMEVQPLSQTDYETLIGLGLHSVYIYQETYNSDNYLKYHLNGKKSNFQYRLDTPDRLGRAKVHRIGLGALLGLSDWRVDALYTARHLQYLTQKYWQTKYSISFPRIRPHEGNYIPNFHMTEAELLQLICAYRIFNEDVELSMSVRESESFRNHIFTLGITSMSAGSKTDPGGYAQDAHALEQFETHDNRSPQEIAAIIQSRGYEPVWKDWDPALMER